MSATRERSRTHMVGVVLVAFLLAVAATPALAGKEARADPLDLLDEVSMDNMVGTVETLQSYGTRAFTLPSTDQVAAYLASQFRLMGLEVQEQEFPVGDRTSWNVVAWKSGTDPERGQVLLGAHYDSENQLATDFALTENLTAPGADDDASGIAIVVEAARLFSMTTTTSTVKFVAFGAEEIGYDNSGGKVGSTCFAKAESLAGVEYRATIILDMVGYRAGDGSVATIVTNELDDPVAGTVEGAAEARGVNLEIETLVKSTVKYSDHASFWAQGYPSILVTEELDTEYSYPLNPYYHTEADTLDKLSLDQMEAVAEAVIGGALLIANASPERSPDALPVVIGVAAVAVVAVAFIIASRRRDSDDRRG